MNEDGIRIIWDVIDGGLVRLSNELILRVKDKFYSGEVDVSPKADFLISEYLGSGNKENLEKLAIWAVNSFLFSGREPAWHLTLIDYLSAHNLIGRREAVELLLIHPSNFSLMNEFDREIVRLAELASEDCLVKSEEDAQEILNLLSKRKEKG